MTRLNSRDRRAENETKYHRLIRIYYQVRVAAYAALFVAIGMHMWGRGYGAAAWALLAAQFLLYPHLLFLHARHAYDSLKAELFNMTLDSLLVGVWAAALEFPTWIAFTLFIGTSINNAINRGWRGALGALLAFSAGALAWVTFAGFRISPNTELPVTALFVLGLSIYLIGLGNIVFSRNRKLRLTREALRQREELYRLITEHAGDLIAMLDAEGRWVYASPSYRRLLPDAAVETGADALSLLHPEDRDAMRAALANAVQTGEPQKILYRLISGADAEHEFQATVSSFWHAGGHKAVIDSIEITELRQRDRKLALQAHAFENMAEAMMIVTADPARTIVSVNRAFTTVTGYGEGDVVGKSESEFRTALEPPQFYDDMHDALLREGRWSATTWGRRKDGSIYRERRTAAAVNNEAGATAYYLIFFADISATQPDQALPR